MAPPQDNRHQGVKRVPHSAQFASAWALINAELGEVLLSFHQPEGSEFLHQAASIANGLAQRDPANAGSAQVQVEVHWRSASGMSAWSNETAAGIPQRQARIEKASEFLDKAKALTGALKADPLRRYLTFDLDRTARKIKESSACLAMHSRPGADHPRP